MILKAPSWLYGDQGRLLGLRATRSFLYGFLQVILAIYLNQVGFSALEIGVLFAVEIVITSLLMVCMSFAGDRYGRKKVLLLSGFFLIVMGITYSTTTSLVALIIGAGVAGIIAGPSQTPFSPIEQALLAGKVEDQSRTTLFSSFFFIGALLTTLGTFMSVVPELLSRSFGLGLLDSYRPLFLLIAVGGVITVFFVLGIKEEPRQSKPKGLLSGKSSSRMLRLTSSLSLDGLGEGFFVPFFALFFYTRFGIDPLILGPVFAAGEILNALGLLVAGRVAMKTGLVNATVLSRFPAILMPLALAFAPTFAIAVVLFVVGRFFSSMDVPLVQSYTMAVIDPDERASVAGVVSMSKRLATVGGPVPAGFLFTQSLLALPFVIGSIFQFMSAGMYYTFFHKIQPPEETATKSSLD